MMIKFDRNSSLVVLSFAVLLVGILGLSTWLQLPIAFRPPSIFTEGNLDAYNQDALGDGAIGSVALDLQLQALPPSVAETERRLAITPYDDFAVYVRDDNSNLDVESVCVDSITLWIKTEPEAHSFLPEPYCHTFNENDWFGDYAYELPDGGQYLLTNHWYVELPQQALVPFATDWPETVGYNFWFPYDSISVDIDIQAQTTITLSDGSQKTETVPIYYMWKLQPSGGRAWDAVMNNTIHRLSAEEEDFSAGALKPGYYNKTELHFQRTPLYLFAFPILLIAMVFFISLVPSMRDSRIEHILSVQTGLLFATFALRSILSPGREIGHTLVEVSIIGLNLLQIFAALVLFIRMARERRSQP